MFTPVVVIVSSRIIPFLLLALYGCAQAVIHLVRLLSRPSKPRLKLMLSLQGENDAEQQIRFARLLSKELSIPLDVEAQALDDASRRIVRALLGEDVSEKLDGEVLRG